jgi:CRP/FNR family cyclic AMP-dependent transcriptional regulator
MEIEAEEHVDLSDITPFAVLVVGGAIGLRTCAGDGRTLEILTHGCVTRPDEDNPTSFVRSTMVAIVPSRLALVDDRVCRWPPVVSEIISRLCQRARSAHAQKAMDSQLGLERRLLFCLWHLAERFGRRRSDGIDLPIPLTHELIAEVMGAARPSVTSALARLTAEGVVTRTPDRGWRLRPDSVDQLFEDSSRSSEA